MLIYYFGDKKIDMSKKEFDSHYINEGLESNVYLFNDRVIKIYKPKCVKIRLDEDTVKRLSKINTERIIMPQDVVYNELNKFCDSFVPNVPVNPKILFSFLWTYFLRKL